MEDGSYSRRSIWGRGDNCKEKFRRLSRKRGSHGIFWKQIVDCGINRRCPDWKHWLESADAEGDPFSQKNLYTKTNKQDGQEGHYKKQMVDGRYVAMLRYPGRQRLELAAAEEYPSSQKKMYTQANKTGNREDGLLETDEGNDILGGSD